MPFENATPRPWKKNRYGQLEGSNGQRVHVYDLGVGMAMNSPDQEERDNADLFLTAVNAFEAMVEALEAFERWEADVILNGDWSSATVRLTQAQHDALSAVQDKRNAALKLARSET